MSRGDPQSCRPGILSATHSYYIGCVNTVLLVRICPCEAAKCSSMRTRAHHMWQRAREAANLQSLGDEATIGRTSANSFRRRNAVKCRSARKCHRASSRARESHDCAEDRIVAARENGHFPAVIQRRAPCHFVGGIVLGVRLGELHAAERVHGSNLGSKSEAETIESVTLVTTQRGQMRHS
jgi:hypothetical protein